MGSFIVFYSGDTEFYIISNVWQRVMSISSTITISAAIYFIILWLLGVKGKKL
jgi:hypothetical protein